MKGVRLFQIAMLGMLVCGCSSTPEEKIEPTLQIGWSAETTYNNKTIVLEYCRVPFNDNGLIIELEGLLYRQKGLSSYRGVVMTHGRNGPHPSRNSNELYGYRQLNCALASEGCAVLYIVRRGYGNSEGRDSEYLRSAVDSGLAAAQDLKAGIEYLRKLENVKPDGLIIMGHSQGGWAALAASNLAIDGVIATVNIAGGTNYSSMGDGSITDEVQEAWRRGSSIIGKKALVPVIWIYAENDRNHPKYRAMAMFKAFYDAGGKGYLHILPAYGDNGHAVVQQPSLFLDLIFTDIREIETK